LIFVYFQSIIKVSDVNLRTNVNILIYYLFLDKNSSNRLHRYHSSLILSLRMVDKTDDFRIPLRGCWSRLYYQSNAYFVLFYFLFFPYTEWKILQNKRKNAINRNFSRIIECMDMLTKNKILFAVIL